MVPKGLWQLLNVTPPLSDPPDRKPKPPPGAQLWHLGADVAKSGPPPSSGGDRWRVKQVLFFVFRPRFRPQFDLDLMWSS